MKLPFASQQNNLSSPDIKPQIIGSGGGKKLKSLSSEDRLPVDNNESANQYEEWDSVMNELEFHDDPAKSAYLLQLPDLPSIQSEVTTPAMPLFLNPESEHANSVVFMNRYNNNSNSNNNPNYNNENEFDFVDELIQVAECVETQSLQLAHVILARLNHRLGSPNGKPLQRAAFYFKEAIQDLLTGSTRLTRLTSSSEIVQLIKANTTFSTVSPIPMFSSFTANQAILEAVDGATVVHVIDFDIGIGGHWASFMKEIAEKSESRRINSPAFRITAVVQEEYGIESRLISDNLTQFARDLKLRFNIDFVSVQTFERLSFKSIRVLDGEKIAVLLTSAIFRRIGVGFVNDLKWVSPDVIVHVDGEGLIGDGPGLFRQKVMDGVEYYSAVLESLEAANIGIGGGDWMRKIEVFVLLPSIIEMVEAAGRCVPPWREAFGKAGMRPVGQSRFADFQAECLLRRIQVRGFHVAKQQGEMVLCWHDRPLVATSAWSC